MTADRQRAHLVKCAQGWIGTPYHTGAKIRGVGADCITWIVGAFEEAGLIPAIQIPFYPPDWHLHRDEERYLKGLAEWCDEVPAPEDFRSLDLPPANPGLASGVGGAAASETAKPRVPLPGDIVVWKIGRCFAHGAIVADWPWALHANIRQKVARANVEQIAGLNFHRSNEADRRKPRPRKFFCLKRWAMP